MEEFPLIVSYYTQGTLYQLEVQNLIASCEKWGLEYHVEPIASFGSWERNCCYKPFFLMQKLQEFARPLLWTDADAVVVQKPRWLDAFGEDFAVRMHDDLEEGHPSKVLTGGVYVNATQGGARILRAWGEECIKAFNDPHRTEEVWDQITLRDALRRGMPGVRIGKLPGAYVAIEGNLKDEKEVPDPVILHYQASRRLKKLINDCGKFNKRL